MSYPGKSQWPDPLFSGMLDEFRIYNHALSAEDVSALAGVPCQWILLLPIGLSRRARQTPMLPTVKVLRGQYDGSMLDVSGNGNHLSSWSGSWEWYRGDVPASVTPQTGVSNSLSLQNANDFNAMSAIGTSLTFWNPTNWTIEAAFKTDRTDSF